MVSESVMEVELPWAGSGGRCSSRGPESEEEEVLSTLESKWSFSCFWLRREWRLVSECVEEERGEVLGGERDAAGLVQSLGGDVLFEPVTPVPKLDATDIHSCSQGRNTKNINWAQGCRLPLAIKVDYKGTRRPKKDVCRYWALPTKR